jgi:hypothetical protein
MRMALVKLSGKLQIELRNALVAAYLNEALFDELLLACEKSLDVLAPTRDAYPIRALAVIKHANQDGWIAELITCARAQKKTDPEIKRIEDEVKAYAPPAVASPFRVCLLSGGHILVNRKDLRDALEELYKGGKRVLIVKDEANLAAQTQKRIKTGKSHSMQLMSYVQQAKEDFEIVAVDLSALSDALPSGELIQPFHLAESICSLMKCENILKEKAKDEQWARWNLNFCNAFEPEAKKRGKTWILIDSFHLVLLPAETMGLIKEIARRINQTLTNMRIVLLGYPESFQHPISPNVTEETVKLISEHELADFFARAYSERNMPCNEDKVARKVLAVFDAIDATRPDFVIQINSLALAELDKP